MPDIVPGARLHGFRLERREHLPEINSEVFLFTHETLGCPALAIKNDDPNKTFCVSFRTVPTDSTGVAHILEHSVLMGSKKYPVRDVFGEIHKGGLLTFLNAMTGADSTYYPFATRNLREYFQIMDVYCDVVFHPLLPFTTFAQEGWHLHLEEERDTPKFQGVVFNEMKGAFADPLRALMRDVYKGLLPGSTYAQESGGDPKNIPDLDYESFVRFHARHYHPSNSAFFFYGDAPLTEELAFVQERYLAAFKEAGEKAQSVPGEAPTSLVTLHDTYPLATGGDTAEKTFLAAASIVGEAKEREKNLAFDLLANILFNSDASPLKNAIVGAQLGKDFGGLFMSDAASTLMLTYLIGAETGDAPAFFKLYRETLEEIAQRGLDHDLVLSELNAFEFKLREEMNKPQRGLHLILRAQEAMKLGVSPFDALGVDALLARVRDRALNGHWLEKLAQKHLLNNPASLELVLAPDAKGMELNRQREEERLQQLTGQLDAAGRQKLVRQTQELLALQNTAPTEQELACLPRLALSDLERRPVIHEARLEEAVGRPLWASALDASGVVYFDLGFDCKGLDLDELLILDIFATIVTELGTAKKDYKRFATELSLYTGGFDHSFQAYIRQGETGVRPVLWLHVRALASFLPKATGLVAEALAETDFSDRRRIEEIVRREFAWAEQNAQSEGYALAAQRCFAQVGLGGKYGDAVQGMSAYQRLKRLVAHYAEEEETFVARLAHIKQKLFRKQGLSCAVTASEADIRHFQSLSSSMLTGLPEFPVGTACNATLPQFQTFPKSAAFTVAAEISYNIQTCRLFPEPGQYAGDFEVLKTWLSREYLWNTVRQKGGAYGCFIQFNHISGNFGLISYRDPRIGGTYDDYAGLAQAVAKLELSHSSLERLIIGAYGAVNPHRGPAGLGALARDRALTGVTREFLENRLDAILGAETGRLRRYADAFHALNKTPYRVTLGNGDKIRGEAKLFETIEEL